MNRNLLFLALIALSACSQSPNVRITQDQPVVKPPSPIKSRSEPVFYNGKTYQVAIAPDSSGLAKVTISGMSDKQAKDASGLGSSAFQHFSCRESQKAHIKSPPIYANGQWNLMTRCG